MYVGGYLRDLSELDSYVSFVRKEGEIGEPTVGILSQSTSTLPSAQLYPLDYQILAFRHEDPAKATQRRGR